MSQSSSFYVTLPSNGSKQYYADNTASVFRNQLTQPLQLEGRWEVALVEMQYPLSWNFMANKNKLGVFFVHKIDIGNRKFYKRNASFKLNTGVLVSIVKRRDLIYDNYTLDYVTNGKRDLHQNQEVSISEEASKISLAMCPMMDEEYVLQVFAPEDSHYKSMTYVEVEFEQNQIASSDYVASVVHAQLKQAILQNINLSNPKFLELYQIFDVFLDTVFDHNNRLSEYYSRYKTLCGLVGFKSSRELLHVMGFKSPKNDVELIQFPNETSKKGPPLKFKTPALYVYTDIITDDYVGDVKIPLLRAVGIEGDRGEFANKEFIHPHYKALKTGYINSIRIEVKDDTGEDIDFAVGKVICTLHFRRCGLEV